MSPLFLLYTFFLSLDLLYFRSRSCNGFTPLCFFSISHNSLFLILSLYVYFFITVSTKKVSSKPWNLSIAPSCWSSEAEPSFLGEISSSSSLSVTNLVSKEFKSAIFCLEKKSHLLTPWNYPKYGLLVFGKTNEPPPSSRIKLLSM